MREQARLGLASGIPQAVVQKNGDIVRLAPGKPGKLAEVRTGRLLLDGDIIAPADGEAMVMRRRLAREGIVVGGRGRQGRRSSSSGIGLPLDEDYAAFVAEAERDVAAALGKLKGAAARDREAAAAKPPAWPPAARRNAGRQEAASPRDPAAEKRR